MVFASQERVECVSNKLHLRLHRKEAKECGRSMKIAQLCYKAKHYEVPC